MAPVGDESRAETGARRKRGIVAFDHEARRWIGTRLGRDRNDGGVIFLVLADHENIARNPARRAIGQIDGIVGFAPARIVETRIGDDGARAARLFR